MGAAARVGDMVLQDAPTHCHMPHPVGVAPAPIPHPAVPLTITGPGAPTVLISNMPAAVMGDMTTPCMLPGCVPGGPGTIVIGAPTVLIGNKPAARVNDMTSHASCVAPLPAPTGKILPPGAPTVMVG